jgi:asparagine N-glycosylation enzyme membrane subunit Stt3
MVAQNVAASGKRGVQQITLTRRRKMSLGAILLIVLVLMLIGAIPSWPHSRSWGYGPSGGLGLVLLIVVVLVVLGRI